MPHFEDYAKMRVDGERQKKTWPLWLIPAVVIAADLALGSPVAEVVAGMFIDDREVLLNAVLAEYVIVALLVLSAYMKRRSGYFNVSMADQWDAHIEEQDRRFEEVTGVKLGRA